MFAVKKHSFLILTMKILFIFSLNREMKYHYCENCDKSFKTKVFCKLHEKITCGRHFQLFARWGSPMEIPCGAAANPTYAGEDDILLYGNPTMFGKDYEKRYGKGGGYMF
jgi:hypothetical protein